VPGVELPKERLAGFQKTRVLTPGQAQRITLAVHLPDLGVWDQKAMKSVVHDGTYAFEVGADADDVRGTAEVAVSGALRPKVQEVTVQPGKVNFQVGQTLDLTGRNPWIADDTDHSKEQRDTSVTADGIVEAAESDGSFADLTNSRVSYRSSDPKVATVGRTGLLRAVGDGTAVITATVDGVSGSTPVTVGHRVAVSAPKLSQPGEDATVTTTFTNTATTGGPVRDVTVGLDLPDGWTAEATTPDRFASVAPGATATTTWKVAVPASAAGTFTIDADATLGGVHDSSGFAQLAVAYPSFTAALNNVAISDDDTRAGAQLDGAGASFSAQALAAAGVTPGAPFAHDGLTFTWPDARPGQNDNVVAAGQTIDLSGSGSTLGFLGTSTWGADSGTGTVTYTDGSTQPFTIGFGDWANGTPPDGGDVAVRAAYGNQPGNRTGWQTTIDYFPVALDPAKTVRSVTLPPGSATPQGGIPAMHVFAMSIKSDHLTVGAPATVEPGGSATVTAALTNPAATALDGVALALDLPKGWTAVNDTPGTFDSVAPGGTAATEWTVTAPKDQAPGSVVLGVTATAGGTPTGVSSAATEVPYASLADAFNNVSITDDADHGPGNIDGGGNSFSAQALAAAGLTPGGTLTVHGLTFTWPAAKAGEPDNVEADGRAFDLTGSGTGTGTGTGSTLGFLGAAANGQAGGTGLITYTDGSTQSFTVGFGDWAGTDPYPGSEVAVTSAYGNTATGTSPWKASVFYDAVALEDGKTVRSVTLPGGGGSPLHVFAAAIG
jgi:hypothetical protein